MEIPDLIYKELEKMSDPDIHIVIETIAKETGEETDDLYYIYDNQ